VKISREKVALLLFDLFALNLAYIASYLVRYKTGWFTAVVAPEFRHLFWPSMLVSTGWILLFALRGQYRTLYGQSPVDILFSVVRASLVGVFVIFLVTIDLQQPFSPSRVVLMSYWGFLILLVGGCRVIMRLTQRRLLRRGVGLRNALIVGYNERARAFLRQIQRVPDLGFRICGFLNGSVDDEYLGVKVIAGYDDLEAKIKSLSIREVILAPSPAERDLTPSLISQLANLRVNVKMLPDLTDTLYGHLGTAAIRGVPLIEVFPDILSPGERTLKRIIDVLAPAVVLVVGLPLWPLIALAIKLDSKGPVLYTQKRVGRGGRLFTLLKFRSMVVDAEAQTGPIWADKRDPRITRVGRHLRHLHLDEMPQFVNVLMGDMSLVGPRPERPAFVEQFRTTIPLYERRLNVKPGITGWAQVKHKYDESLTDVADKLRYDLFYLENMSLALDVKIILSTIGVMVAGRGH
jgi:exopolysaccharide biosynthesis polyprenyl glycosylphosphotransferase